ncbi:MAG TPA: translation initiation factor IF-2 N-terminal domain-containing protein, partial [Acidimicrobiia bacterium]
MRVYELARELGVESKDVLAQADELGIDVKTASSGIDDESVELVRLAFAPEEETTVPEEETTVPEEETTVP